VTLFETFYNDKRAALMDKITRSSRLDKSSFAIRHRGVEAALKFARVSTAVRTLSRPCALPWADDGALSATYNKKYKEAFEPLVPGFTTWPITTSPLWKRRDGSGGGGHPRSSPGRRRRVPGRSGLFAGGSPHLYGPSTLLIIDEIQAGLGRTGKMFAFQHSGIPRHRLHREITGRWPADGSRAVWDSVKNLPRLAWFDLRR